MAVTKYTYSIATDTLIAKLDTVALIQEIAVSPVLIALDHVETNGDVLDIYMKDALSISAPNDVANLLAVVNVHPGVPIPENEIINTIITNPQTANKRIRVAVEKSDTSSKNFYSHNWCNKTTWYENSIRVIEEVAIDSGDQLTYNLIKNNLIDSYHGRITGEDDLKDSGDNSYRVVVTVNDVAKTEQDPHPSAGGDYTINYATGNVVFLSALTGGDVVKVTYHYADIGNNGSLFTIKPLAGKKLIIDQVEIQFTVDVEITDTIIFETYGLVDVFAPQLMPGVPSGTLISIKKKVYKTIMDLQNDAFRSYPTYPAIGGSSWRGLTQEVLIMDWDYLTGLTISSAAGMEVRLYMEHDVSYGGTFGTTTLYCISEDE